LMPSVRQFIELIDRQTIGVSAAAIVSTFVCVQTGITADLPFELVGVAIVFPIVFTISGAFQRRENALDELAELRANLIAIFYAHRDWAHENGATHARRMGELLKELHQTMREGLRQPSDHVVRAVYGYFSQISQSHELLRTSGSVSPSELARVNQYLRDAITNF